MKQAFVSIVSSYVGYCIASVLRRDGYDVVGSTRAEDTEDIAALVSQTVDVDDEAGTTQLALRSDVVVLCLLEDVRGADAVLSALQTPPGKRVGGPSHLLVLSTTMTWARTKKAALSGTAQSSEMPTSPPSRALSRPVSMMAMGGRATQGASGGGGGGGGGGAGGVGLPRVSSAVQRSSPSRDGSRSLGTANSKNSGRPSHASSFFSRRRPQEAAREPAMTEADYLLRQPPTGYLEHKRLETAALHLRSPALSACVVGAGVPYGLGEGPVLLRLFRDAWRARGAPVVLPTCTAGNNHPALIHVVDLSVAVGNMLRPTDRRVGAPPPPFPKPYVLAVEGDGAQCTAQELTAAIGRGFGGSGETQPMGEAELEDVLVEDPAALALLANVRFSNHGGVLAGMVADGTLEPIAWSKGFVASATSVAQEFMASRSLQPIKAVILGPPGGYQDHVCQQISQTYGLLRVDAKVAVDGVFEALGKPVPLPVPMEEREKATPGAKGGAAKGPAAKGKKAKQDTKKGAAKAEPSPEAEAALAALPPTERLLAEVQAAFEAADVPMTDYASLDARSLATLLSPSVVARSTRLFLEEKKALWACSGYILCDLPSHGDVASEIFGDRPPFSPQQAARNSDTSAVAAPDTAAATAAGGAVRPKSRGGGGEGSDGSSSPSTSANPASAAATAAAAGGQSDEVSGSVSGWYRPTHVVYLDASLEYIVAQQERRGGAGAAGGSGGKEAEAKLRADLERYFAQEQQQQQQKGELPDGGSTSAGKNSAPGEKQPQSNAGPSGGERKANPAGKGGDGGGKARWVPATARALQDHLKVEVEVVDVEGTGGVGGGEGNGPGAGVVAAVDDHLCGGEVPAFVAMLSEGDRGDATAAGAVAVVGEGGSSAVAKHEELDPRTPRSADSGGDKNDGNGDGVGDDNDGDDNLSGPLNTDSNADDDTLGDLNLTEVLSKLTARDAREVETRTRRHRNFLTTGVVPQVAAGLVAAAEAQPDNIFEFLAEYLIRAGKELQTKAEEEAAEKYQAGLALLQEMEAKDNMRTAAVYR